MIINSHGCAPNNSFKPKPTSRLGLALAAGRLSSPYSLLRRLFGRVGRTLVANNPRALQPALRPSGLASLMKHQGA